MASKQKPGREAKKPKGTTSKRAKLTEPCRHPLNRRIGTSCPVCGATGLR